MSPKRLKSTVICTEQMCAGALTGLHLFALQDEKEGEGEGEDSDEDDGFFVPHGYLSNDEGDCDEGDGYIPAPGEDVS